MKTKRFPYRVTVAWSNEDNLYVARVPKLAGILGLDERDPTKAIRKAIQRGWDAVAALADNGHPLPEPDDWSKKPSGQFYVRLLPDLHASLREWAEEEGVSMNALISHILTAATARRTLFPQQTDQAKPRRNRQSRAA
jgi:predicted HicB family RNase H-like nuclease